VIYPIQCPEDFEMFGISPPKGILIYGPPGVGKTSICCALAYETGFNLITIEVKNLNIFFKKNYWYIYKYKFMLFCKLNH